MSDTRKTIPDYQVTFACSECMFSTTSGISSQEHRDWHKQEDQLYEELENVVVELGIRKSLDALNSYNPERERRLSMSRTKYPLPPEHGPYRLAIYNGKDELVTVITQVKVDNVRPKVEKLVSLVIKDSIFGNQTSWRKPTNEEWLEIVAKAHEVEAKLKKS